MVCVPGNMVAGWAVAFFASDTKQHVLAVIFVHRAGSLLEPDVVTLQAAGGHFAGKVSRPIAVELAGAPGVLRQQASHRKLIEPVPLPAKVDLVGDSTQAIDERNHGSCFLGLSAW